MCRLENVETDRANQCTKHASWALYKVDYRRGSIRDWSCNYLDYVAVKECNALCPYCSDALECRAP